MKTKKKANQYTFDFSSSTFNLRQVDQSWTRDDGTIHRLFEYRLFVSPEVKLNGLYEAYIRAHLILGSSNHGWTIDIQSMGACDHSKLQAAAALLNYINELWDEMRLKYSGFTSLDYNFLIDAMLDSRFISALYDQRSQLVSYEKREEMRRFETAVRRQQIQAQLDRYDAMVKQEQEEQTKTEAA